DGLVDELEPVTARADGDGRTHRRYTITDAGRREVAAWLASGSGDKAPPRDELLTKVLVALGRSATTALAVIDTQRNLLYDELRRGQHQQRRRAAGPERLAHDALLARLDADIDWLDRCEMHITAAAAAGAGPTAPSAHPTDVSSDTTDPTDASSDPRQNEPATTDRTDPTERLS
ncbi:MAG: hypothetical protein JJU45_05450, partial [Acidimicrobiia bacterium]|nr:hypothetical protein [Acidimicrobiia bacterium]